MKSVLITGGAGFFGEILKGFLLARQIRCISIDLQPDYMESPLLTSIQGDIRDLELMKRIFSAHSFDTIFHCAALLAHEAKNRQQVWSHNVDGAKAIAKMANLFKIPKVVYISSNCLWGRPLGHPVAEGEPPCPAEIYGQSKWAAEKMLLDDANDFMAVSIRCPTIIDCGRLGLLAMLFQFIEEGRKVWVVGNGCNRYQFIYARDLADACIRAADHDKSDIFNIGSESVKSMREVYQYVIDHAGTTSRIVTLPKLPSLLAMKLFHKLGISPLGPYQYRMIAEDFMFDTSKIRSTLGWRPTLTNEQMLLKAYQYYQEHKIELSSRSNVSAHKKPAKMGIINILRLLS